MDEEKSYYSISEASKITGVSIATLRFWEKEIPQLKPQKSAGNTRRYTQQDLETIRKIVFLTEGCCLTLEGVRRKLGERNLKVDVHTRIYERLLRARKELSDIRREINGVEALDQEVIVD